MSLPIQTPGQFRIVSETCACPAHQVAGDYSFNLPPGDYYVWRPRRVSRRLQDVTFSKSEPDAVRVRVAEGERKLQDVRLMVRMKPMILAMLLRGADIAASSEPAAARRPAARRPPRAGSVTAAITGVVLSPDTDPLPSGPRSRHAPRK